MKLDQRREQTIFVAGSRILLLRRLNYNCWLLPAPGVVEKGGGVFYRI